MPISDKRSFKPVRIAILTVSDTRTEADDKSGDTLVQRLSDSGHELAGRAIVKDGVTGRDVTPEAFAKVVEKEIPGFGELFRWISFQKIGTSTMQSRAVAGVANGTYLFALPGSTGACRDAWDEILQHQLDYRFMPCNFVEMMPRLLET